MNWMCQQIEAARRCMTDSTVKKPAEKPRRDPARQHYNSPRKKEINRAAYERDDMIVEAIRHGASNAAAIEQQLGLKRSMVYDAIKRLVTAERIERTGRGEYHIKGAPKAKAKAKAKARKKAPAKATSEVKA